MISGDVSAACYRLYNPKRKDQQGGARPDLNNCTFAVAIEMFENAYNTNTPIEERIKLSQVHAINAYALAPESMEDKMNHPTSRLKATSADTIVAVIFDHSRNADHHQQRIQQRDYTVKEFRINHPYWWDAN